MPNDLHVFISALKEHIPNTQIDVDNPLNSNGEYWLDIVSDQFATSVVWQAHRGFGFFTGKSVFSEKPDELYRTPQRAIKRFQQLSGKRSESLASLLKELRAIVDVSQENLAQKLDVKQAAISRLESRDDLKLSTFISYMKGLDVRLEIKAYGDDFELTVPVEDKESRLKGDPL